MMKIYIAILTLLLEIVPAKQKLCINTRHAINQSVT